MERVGCRDSPGTPDPVDPCLCPTAEPPGSETLVRGDPGPTHDRTGDRNKEENHSQPNPSPPDCSSSNIHGRLPDRTHSGTRTLGLGVGENEIPQPHPHHERRLGTCAYERLRTNQRYPWYSTTTDEPSLSFPTDLPLSTQVPTEESGLRRKEGEMSLRTVLDPTLAWGPTGPQERSPGTGSVPLNPELDQSGSIRPDGRGRVEDLSFVSRSDSYRWSETVDPSPEDQTAVPPLEGRRTNVGGTRNRLRDRRRS